MKKKIVAFLPAKGSSQRIQNKNMRLLDGKPLFLHTLEKLCECEFIDEVYLDSESDEILNCAPYLRYIPLKRDPALATNQTDGHQMFYNEVRQVEADIYIQILGTSPFIEKETIKRGIDAITDSKYDSAVLVRRDKLYIWNGNEPEYDRNHVPNSVDLPDTLTETMGLYIVKADTAHRLKQRYGEKVFCLDAKPIEAVDVNFPNDFDFAEIIMKGIHSREVSLFRILSKQLSSSIFADILTDLRCDTIIPGLKLNMPDARIMGRANTLSLRQLRAGEDFNGIYDALKTYDRVRNGEVIIVENQCPEYAYFGELNANLAIRSGAIATIIDGVTRDSQAVRGLGYPVFAKGFSCRDVRGRGTFKCHNQPVCIGGVRINPGDIIMGDNDGVVMIPKEIETQVIKRAIDSVSAEKSVISRIINYEDAYSIYKLEGAF